MQSGRWLGACIFSLLNNLGIYAGAIQQIRTVIHIGLLSICALMLYNIIAPRDTEFNLIRLGFYGVVLVTFCNVFYQELFFYSENGLTMGIGILLCTLAIRVSARIANVGKDFLVATILLSMSLGIYQAFLSIYISWCLIIVLIRTDETRVFLKRASSIIAIGAISSILNIIVLKIILNTQFAEESTREPLFTITHFLKRTSELLIAQKNIWFHSYGFLPSGIVLLVMLYSFFTVFRGDQGRRNACRLLLICLCSLGVTFAPHLLVNDLWLAQRTLIGIFAIVAITLFSALVLNRKFRNTTVLVVTCFLFLNIVQMQRIAENHFATNRLDQASVLRVQDAIDEYEATSGYLVKYIGTKNDMNPTYSYPGIQYVILDTNTRALVVDWADVELLNYYTGHKYIKVPMDDSIFNAYFEGKDWNKFDCDEQIKFDKETMYWVKY